MAELLRVTNYGDASHTMTFTFILPPQTSLKDGAPEILSREFSYVGHRWRLSLSKKDGQHLSPYLELCKLASGLKCTLDFTFLLLNRDSYTQNEKHERQKCEFSSLDFRHGARIFISLEDLRSREGFTDTTQQYLFELSLRNPKTEFETRFQLKSLSQVDPDFCRYDSEKFRFGDSEWVVVFCPNMDSEFQPRHLFQLQCIGRPESMSKLKYRLSIGTSHQKFRSPILEEIIDFSGQSQGIYMSENYIQYCDGEYLPIRLELEEAAQVSISKLNVQNVVRGQSLKTNGTVCYDKEKQTWVLSPNVFGDFLSINIHYTDISNIPPGYLRCVQWRCSLMPSDKFAGSVKPVQAADSVYLGYYSAHSGKDRGVKMRFPVKMTEIKDSQSPWTDAFDGKVTIEIYWIDAYLLVCPNYTTHDDTVRRHNMQMRREIEALQKENNMLEKELHNYQISISTKCSTSVPESHAGSPHHMVMPYQPITGGRNEDCPGSVRSRLEDLSIVKENRGSSGFLQDHAKASEQPHRRDLQPETVTFRSRSVEPPEAWRDQEFNKNHAPPPSLTNKYEY